MSQHIPVLADAALDWLGIRVDGVYVDCTAGLAGHSLLIASRLAGGRLIALDRDMASVEIARERLVGFSNAVVVHGNYGELKAVLGGLGVDEVDGVLIDAGFSSMQLEDARRGFTFQQDGPLDMRLDALSGETAREFLARLGEVELARVLKEYGDVGPARRIAAAIVRRRERGRMETTGDLAGAVCEALDFVSGQPDEIRTVFQAVRIAVNEELRWLRKGLEEAIDVLRPGGRLVAIAFHSGEDRVVKNVLRDASRPRHDLYPDGRIRSTQPPRVRVLTAKPVKPGAVEIARNPRAKSALLRAAEKLEAA
jgi:16S rRNA (cytosine1402-N4)-methyltransferase